MTYLPPHDPAFDDTATDDATIALLLDGPDNSWIVRADQALDLHEAVRRPNRVTIALCGPCGCEIETVGATFMSGAQARDAALTAGHVAACHRIATDKTEPAWRRWIARLRFRLVAWIVRPRASKVSR